MIIFTVKNIGFSISYQNFPAEFPLGLILLLECRVPFDFQKITDVLAIFILNHSRYICGKLIYTLYSGLGRIVLCKALEMSNTKIINTSAYAMEMLMQRERMPAAGAYDTVKLTTSSMDDPSAHVL